MKRHARAAAAVALVAIPLALHAASSFSSRSKTCPVGYGCVYGSDSRGALSQGLDIEAGYPENHFITLPYPRATPRQVRNRNSTTRRSVVLSRGDSTCYALRYDSRTWVNIPPLRASPHTAWSMGLVRASHAPGRVTSHPCRTTIWL